jgi:hypothetical protein
MEWVSFLLPLMLLSAPALGNETVKINDGLLAGSLDVITAIRSFKGLPFAAPPLRRCPIHNTEYAHGQSI